LRPKNWRHALDGAFTQRNDTQLICTQYYIFGIYRNDFSYIFIAIDGFYPKKSSILGDLARGNNGLEKKRNEEKNFHRITSFNNKIRRQNTSLIYLRFEMQLYPVLPIISQD